MHLPKQKQEFSAVPVGTPRPEELLDELFGRAIEECKRSVELIEARDARGKGTAINKALEIVETLDLALDHTVAPELCAHLESLYLYVQERLVRANIEFDAGPVAEATKILEDLRSAFSQAAAAVSVAK